jgi:hypothetical protein
LPRHYRLSISPARDHCLPKGALLFDLWFDLPHRPTRDADFPGFGPVDRDALARHVRDVCVVAVEALHQARPERVAETRPATVGCRVHPDRT